MKKSNFNYQNQYYNSGTRSRYSSRSSRRLQSEWGGCSSTSSRNRFYNRIEKACTTFNSKDMNKELYLCRKEIQRLEKQVLKKDKVIFELRQSNMHNKQIQTQLVEVYRVLYMYEGKISEYEKELKKLELAIASQVPKDITLQVEELLQSYRVQNSELHAELQEKNKMVMDFQIKFKKMENKYFSTVWKLSSTKRQVANPLKKRFPNLRNTITINEVPLLEKEKALKRQIKRTKDLDYPSQYEISVGPQKEKPAVNFNKVQPLNPLQNKSSPIKNIGQGLTNQINQTPKTYPKASVEPFSFQKSRQNNINIINVGSPSQASNRIIKYSTGQFPPGNLQSANPPNQSNTNMNSQMTVSNAETARRLEFKDNRIESPRVVQYRATSSNLTSYAISKDLNEVNNIVKNVERRVSYIPARNVNSTGQSIYLS